MRDRVSRHKRVLVSPLHPLLQIPEALLNSHSFIDVLSSDKFLATVIIVDLDSYSALCPAHRPRSSNGCNAHTLNLESIRYVPSIDVWNLTFHSQRMFRNGSTTVTTGSRRSTTSTRQHRWTKSSGTSRSNCSNRTCEIL